MNGSGYPRHRLVHSLSFRCRTREELDDALLRLIQPALDALQRGGALRSWFFDLAPDPQRPGRVLVDLYLRPRGAGSSAALESALERALAAALPGHGGARVPGRTGPGPEYLRSRFGGERALGLYELFAPLQASSTLGLLAEWAARGRPCPRVQLALAALFTQLDALLPSPREAAAGLDAWMPEYAGKLGLAEALGEFRAAARRRADDPALADWLESARRGAPDAFGSVTARFRRPFQRLGRLLRAEHQALPERALPRLVLHSYCHVGLVLLGASGSEELMAEAIALEWLRRGGASDTSSSER